MGESYPEAGAPGVEAFSAEETRGLALFQTRGLVAPLWTSTPVAFGGARSRHTTQLYTLWAWHAAVLIGDEGIVPSPRYYQRSALALHPQQSKELLGAAC